MYRRVLIGRATRAHTHRLDWKTVLKMIVDTARGMAFLHSAKPSILHRDLKVRRRGASMVLPVLVQLTWAVLWSRVAICLWMTRTQSSCRTSGWLV